ncbi:substrate-binding domain-containing protein [uncultured Pseudodesulfovibrio sp.]|uniref:substrate-binding domain-containing protein n=1 Tax=uncultured Pseudodesulfovibrio sp. TaxID=2035858 RepID=UPI0029C62A95|nr:substrate-binding domain-containing protein [uncultured Pseudodesulfovibrio sp.]
MGVATPCLAKGRLFFVVAKSESDLNFVRVYNAAKAEAEVHGDRVVLTGGKGKAHFRIQDESIREALRQSPNGLAVSVLRSEYLVENSFRQVHETGTPVVTFDSDFSEPYRSMRAGYIGTDNVELGRELARQAQKLRPQGGVAVILTGGLDDTNLNDRISGVRQQLVSGDAGSRWSLHARSPIPCRDNYEQALAQLRNMLDDPEVNVIISVGWWAEMAEGYASLVENYRAQLSRGDKVLVFAGAHPKQRELFAQRLSHVNIGLDFEEMGRLVYKYLVRLDKGRTIPEVTYTPMDILSQDCQYAPAR